MYISRVATGKLIPRNCVRYLQTTLIMEEGGLDSKFKWDIVEKVKQKLKRGLELSDIFYLKLTLFNIWNIPNNSMTNGVTLWLMWSSRTLKCWNYGEIQWIFLLQVNILRIQPVLFCYWETEKALINLMYLFCGIHY